MDKPPQSLRFQKDKVLFLMCTSFQKKHHQNKKRSVYLLFESLHASEHTDVNMVLLQANLDDMNPEWTSYVMELLFEAGANDVFWVPIVMKRGRPGFMLNVLTDVKKMNPMEEIIFRETTTLGIRRLEASVHRLGRHWRDVTTRWGNIRVKVGTHQGREVQYAPEYRECVEIAQKEHVPLKEVYDEVRRAYVQNK
jgi:uncharacterized protein (DUF111 family)